MRNETKVSNGDYVWFVVVVGVWTATRLGTEIVTQFVTPINQALKRSHNNHVTPKST